MPEQRKHKRVNTPEGTFALADYCMGKVIDISKGGLSLMFLDDFNINTDIPSEMSLDFLSTDSVIKAMTVRVKLAWQEDVSGSHTFGVYRKVGVQFEQLTTRQKTQLDYLLLSYKVGIAC